MTINEQGFYDIYSFHHIPLWHKPWFVMAIVIVGLLCIIAIALWYFLRKKKKKNAAQIALMQLDRICVDGELSQRVIRDHYISLSGILKVYLHIQYVDYSSSMTDYEMLERLRLDKRIQNAQTIIAMFEHVPMKKFSELLSEQEQLRRDIDLVRSFIRITNQALMEKKK